MLRLNCDLLFQAAVLEMEKRKKIEDAQIEEEQEQVKNKKKDFKKNVQVCDLALSSCLIQVRRRHNTFERQKYAGLGIGKLE